MTDEYPDAAYYPDALRDWVRQTLNTDSVQRWPMSARSRNRSYRLMAHNRLYVLKLVHPTRAAALAHELAILDYVREHGFPVPNVIAVARDLPGVPETAVLRSYLRSWPAAELSHFVPSQYHTRFFTAMGDLIARIHMLPLEAVSAFWQFPEDTVQTPREWATSFVQKKVASDLGVILPSGALGGDISQEMATMLPRWAEALADASLRIAPLHGDYYLDNLLVNDEGMICGLLDWEAARLGDPLWELARTQMAAFAETPAAWDTFIAAYTARAPWAVDAGRVACYRFLMAMGDLRYAVRHAPALIPPRAAHLARLWRQLVEDGTWS